MFKPTFMNLANITDAIIPKMRVWICEKLPVVINDYRSTVLDFIILTIVKIQLGMHCLENLGIETSNHLKDLLEKNQFNYS